MYASKAAVSLRNLPLTPDRIPSFIIPSRSPLVLSPLFLSPRSRRQASQTDRTRLLAPCSPKQNRHLSPSSRFISLPSPATKIRLHHHRHHEKDDLVDPSTRAAMTLSHVDKVPTPYGFCALSESPSTRRRESLFHKGTGGGESLFHKGTGGGESLFHKGTGGGESLFHKGTGGETGCGARSPCPTGHTRPAGAQSGLAEEAHSIPVTPEAHSIPATPETPRSTLKTGRAAMQQFLAKPLTVLRSSIQVKKNRAKDQGRT